VEPSGQERRARRMNPRPSMSIVDASLKAQYQLARAEE
jgi:hypothetical protein